ncbi:hypothetical protein A3715_33180 [Oleiphilus sp. HI0009]|nr:hypothetical protein A3715_08185 [Oleiphilus sp. HI0009]KZY67118.1 hypothetical protein A3738_05415 [Oleiphilus sp. HI0066]KZY73935.1 hypothetical protein A3739_02610 [Oleiphilus sp. HI0067]KZZ55946.1 hypothetical protein A3762_11720 [Oleiphilus sp. HI0125]KZX82905.1 hypothetical protein A3715_33180 [Oleiphilus sp. HI0009]
MASTASSPGQQQDAAVAHAFENQQFDFQFLEEIGLWPISFRNLLKPLSVGETLVGQSYS